MEFGPAILEICSYRQYVRSNFLAVAAGGSFQNRIRDITALVDAGELRRHLPAGEEVPYRQQYNPNFFHLVSLASRKNKLNWHQVAVDDFGLAVEIQAKALGLPFRRKEQILGDKPLQLPSTIFHPVTHEKYDKPLEPDDLFAIGDTYFVVEVDRHTERVDAPQFKDTKSALRSLFQYRHAFKNDTFNSAWGISKDDVCVLYTLTNDNNATNLLQMVESLGHQPRSIYFNSFPELVSTTKNPKPNLRIFGDWARVGHPIENLKEVIKRGRSSHQRVA